MLFRRDKPAAEESAGFFQRLRRKLNRGSSWLTDGLATLFRGRKIDAEILEELETRPADRRCRRRGHAVHPGGSAQTGRAPGTGRCRSADRSTAPVGARDSGAVRHPAGDRHDAQAVRHPGRWGSTARARPRPSASSLSGCQMPDTASCSRRATPFGPRPSSSCRSGRPAPARRWSRSRPARIQRRWCLMPPSPRVRAASKY